MKKLKIAEKLSNSKAYIVGGYPRDIVMKKNPRDIDVVVFGDWEKFYTEFSKVVGKKPVVVGKFKIAKFFLDIEINITPAKAKDVIEDLKRRDFTINALLMTIEEQQILDPLGLAMEDINLKIIRTPDNPYKTLKEDPVRIVRIARFLADGFEVEEKTFKAAKELVKTLSSSPYQKIGEELRLIMLGEKPSRAFFFLRDIGFFFLFPDIEPALWKEQKSPYHFEGVFEHSLRVVDICPKDIVLRYSAFFHDIGKAFTEKVLPDGKVVYWGHEHVSEKIADKFLSIFHFPAEEREKIKFIVKNHMIQYSPSWSDSAVRRLISKLGENLNPVLEFVKYDILALKDPLPSLKNLEELKERIKNEIIKLGTRKIKSPLSGYEIMEIFKLPPGPEIGRLKKVLEEAIIEGKINPDKQSSINFLKKYIKENIEFKKIVEGSRIRGEK